MPTWGGWSGLNSSLVRVNVLYRYTGLLVIKTCLLYLSLSSCLSCYLCAYACLACLCVLACSMTWGCCSSDKRCVLGGVATLLVLKGTHVRSQKAELPSFRCDAASANVATGTHIDMWVDLHVFAPEYWVCILNLCIHYTIAIPSCPQSTGIVQGCPRAKSVPIGYLDSSPILLAM